MTGGSPLQVLGLARLLTEQPGLRLRPSAGGEFVVTGTFHLHAQFGTRTLERDFQIEIRVHPDPRAHPPAVREVGGVIPPNFHHLDNGELCLGSPMRIRDVLLGPEPLWRYTERLLVPYLYTFAHRERFGELPFGELAHGPEGLLDDYRRTLGLGSDRACVEALRLLARRKRDANKRKCPCSSGLRLGRCHNRRLNVLRARHGRAWFAGEANQFNGVPLRP